MITSVSATFSNGTVASMTSEYPFYARLKHRHEVDGKSILEWAGYPLYPAQPTKPIGVPSVIRAVTPNQADYCLFTCNWQKFSFALISKWVMKQKPYYSISTVHAEAEKIFFSMYRSDAFQSNKRGTDIRRDCINQTHSTREWVGLQPIFTGGNIVKVIGEKVLKAGIWYYPVECFDSTKPPPYAADVNWDTSPHLINFATIETRIPQDDGRVIRPFEFRGVPGVPFFVLVHGSSVAYINSNRIEKIDESEIHNNDPYK